MDFSVPAPLVELRAEAVEVGRTGAAMLASPEDAWLIGHSKEFARELAKRDWIGMTWPNEVGGHGRPPLERFMVYEGLLSVGAPVASSWMADRQIGPTIVRYGTPEQQRRWLPGIIAGEDMWSIGLSEPDAGSDVAAIRTRARRVGDEWEIDGAKIWTSGAHEAEYCYLVTRTSHHEKRHIGLSEFVVPMASPGVSVRPIRDMTGARHFCEISFEGVRVPADHLIGEQDGSFRQIMAQLEHERGGADRLLSNRRLYDDVVGSGLVNTDNPLHRQEMAAIEGGYRVGRLLVLRGMLGQATSSYSAVTKLACTEFEQRVASFCSAAAGMGSVAYTDGDELRRRIARNVSYARAYTIMGGTTQILRNIVGERVLSLPR